jgi:hypothetical protein
MEDTAKKQTLKQFYFNSSWYSLLTTSYLFLFSFFAIFYLDNVFSAIAFVFRTLFVSTTLLPMSSAVWGAAYVISLLLPFTVSISAIFALPKIWATPTWKKDQKILATIAITIVILVVMLIASDLIQTIGKLDVLAPFVGK